MAKFEVNEDLVRKLADLLQETGLTEIEYEVNDHRIRVAKNPGVAAFAPAAALPAAPCMPQKPAGGPEAIPVGAITPPLVGPAYVAGEPAFPAFVTVRDESREGPFPLINEAIKVLHPPLPPPAAPSKTPTHH